MYGTRFLTELTHFAVEITPPARRTFVALSFIQEPLRAKRAVEICLGGLAIPLARHHNSPQAFCQYVHVSGRRTTKVAAAEYLMIFGHGFANAPAVFATESPSDPRSWQATTLFESECRVLNVH